ncbi:hypothetical protein SAMN04488505_1011120 [Chitinophaga rupis]|uniref:Zinc-finger n=1 Tax=Chitinophaga rupis TaxID=573321 RepID=A0A1H7KY81_9BACT|nr:hypothetical protein [Chitinophaga rupis]SEK91065.1 hypothetical protein SAMN04488505_1011120 [Chitinophaga rupis]
MPVDINISNYEEFLLSYIDGELNTEERTALEAFLQQHPAQAKELEVYKAAILKPDTGEVFNDKALLYRSTVITLENYEPFLLSYIDGELNAAETTALQTFLDKYPHVAQELETWQAMRLSAVDTPAFEHKEMLYRHTATLTTDNYETYFLSYIDGELTAAEEQTLQQFLQQHPELQASLQLLQRTKLQADPALHMPGKAGLYRKTTTKVRISPIWWGAAAAVVAGAFLLWILPLQQGAQNTAIVAASQQGQTATPAAPGQNLQKAAPSVSLPVTQQPAPALANNTPAAVPEKHALIAKNNTPIKRTVTQKAAVSPSAAASANTNTVIGNNAQPALAQLPQPRATSEEVVQQHLEKKIQTTAEVPPVQDVAANRDQTMASSVKLPHTPAPEAQPAAAAPAPEIQGELIMSVTSSSESRLLNGVTNVAKFFSRKKHQK